MKKPNITQGEWYVNKSVFSDSPIVTTKENGWVADIPQSDGMESANAKAISAVPEMIDALIEVYNYMDSGDDPIREEVKQALKKAGVQL